MRKQFQLCRGHKRTKKRGACCYQRHGRLQIHEQNKS